ncbi:ribonuclease HI family protein [Patescibacteria group bacterium]|nr:ribonuclease HI family protein [Patescibacteria group bacterium]MCG2702608.1 ribonuclease HI family protein [Candidatus Parcubacteria bacterium]MBU4265498.1 ribonuclease HI family protein [Patescibacteria group bacterium]MBU4390548.1 ribonuclease HI family protein [Patescibacteria group bacterium]MBU4397218.1 ribonuclease HI family protein [Patescibacteria group bacterium]
MKLSIYTDGGARGNPGPAGCGFVCIDENGLQIHQYSEFLGTKTNNEAEYIGLITALKWLINNQTIHKITKTTIFMDSQLIVRQMQGKYKVKAPNLKIYYQQAITLLSKVVSPLNFQDITRDKNNTADALANQAMDRG